MLSILYCDAHWQAVEAIANRIPYLRNLGQAVSYQWQ